MIPETIDFASKHRMLDVAAAWFIRELPTIKSFMINGVEYLQKNGGLIPYLKSLWNNPAKEATIINEISVQPSNENKQS